MLAKQQANTKPCHKLLQYQYDDSVKRAWENKIVSETNAHPSELATTAKAVPFVGRIQRIISEILNKGS